MLSRHLLRFKQSVEGALKVRLTLLSADSVMEP